MIDADKRRADILARLNEGSDGGAGGGGGGGAEPIAPPELLSPAPEREILRAIAAAVERDRAAKERERAAEEARKAAKQRAEQAAIADAVRIQREMYERATAAATATKTPPPPPRPKRTDPPPSGTTSPPIPAPPPAQIAKPATVMAAAAAAAAPPPSQGNPKSDMLASMVAMGFAAEAAREAIDVYGTGDDKVFAFASAYTTLAGEMRFPGAALRRPLVLFDCDVVRTSTYMAQFTALMAATGASVADVQHAMELYNDDAAQAKRHLEAVRDLRQMGFENHRIEDAIKRYGAASALAHLIGGH
jgi:hypothetical protein